MNIASVVPMIERPIVKQEFKPRRNPNDKVRIAIYKRTCNKSTKTLRSLAELVA